MTHIENHTYDIFDRDYVVIERVELTNAYICDPQETFYFYDDGSKPIDDWETYQHKIYNLIKRF